MSDKPQGSLSDYLSVQDHFEKHGRLPRGIPPEHLEEVRDSLSKDRNPDLWAALDAAIADPD